jgi:hypothetical protein
MKKILSIVGIAIIIILLGLMSYYYFVFNKVDPATGQKETFRQFLPFGSSGASHTPSSTDQQAQTLPNENASIPINLPALQQISSEPVAGSVIIEAPYATTTLARYMNRATGNIFDYAIASGTTARITNTTFPKVIETLWSPTGSKVIMRYLENDNDYITSYYAELKNSTSSEVTSELKGNFLPPRLDFVTLLGKSDTLFSLMSSPEGALGYTSTLGGANRTLVFKSPIREWIPQGINNVGVALTTKAASYTDGFLYMFDPSTSSMTKILGNVMGLTTLMSPNSQYALISENNNGFTLKLLDIKNKKVMPLTLATIPEKCAWAPDSSEAFCGVSRQNLNPDFLDLWYQGIVSTSDDLWVIEPVNTNVGILANVADKNIDMTELAVNKTKKYITFKNKKDLSLWVYRIPTQKAPAQPLSSSTSATQSGL